MKLPLMKKQSEKLKTGVRFTITKTKGIMLNNLSDTLLYFQKKI